MNAMKCARRASALPGSAMSFFALPQCSGAADTVRKHSTAFEVNPLPWYPGRPGNLKRVVATQFARRSHIERQKNTDKVEIEVEELPLNSNCMKCLAKEIPVAACWMCGAERKDAHAMFCDSCGSIQPPSKVSYFKLFDIEKPDFEVDVKNMEVKYKSLMRRLHPDKYMQMCARTREFSSAQTAAVNVAYRTLKDPFNRASYMLEEMGASLEEKDTCTTDPEFMMEIMELCEEIEDARGNQEKLAAIKRSGFHSRLVPALKAAAAAFRAGDAAAAQEATSRLQYLKRAGELLGEELEVS